jgi:integrase
LPLLATRGPGLALMINSVGGADLFQRTTADRLREASAHWLRHTFATAALLKGQDIRTVASMLGHSSVETTMNYTRQGALDVVRASEKVDFGGIAQVQSPVFLDGKEFDLK